MKTYINYHVIITVLVVILSCSACSKKETGQPDVVCSMKNNRDEMLTVIANRDKIHDKDKFAEHLLQMYKDNAFDSMLLSVDMGYLQIATFCGQQGRIPRTVRAILSGQF